MVTGRNVQDDLGAHYCLSSLNTSDKRITHGMPRKESTTGHISAQAQQDLVSDGIENYELPKSIVTKISKSAVRPPFRMVLGKTG